MRGPGWTPLPVIVTAGAQDGPETGKSRGGRPCMPPPSVRFSLRQKYLICAEYCLDLPAASLMMKLTFVSTPGLGVIR